MIADGPRTKDLPTDEDGNPIDENEIVEQELTTKEEIKNIEEDYIFPKLL